MQIIKNFTIELIDGTDEDIGSNYSGTELAYLVADAYIRIRNGETTSFSNFACYREYLASGGKAKLTYEEALHTLPAKDSYLYKFRPDFWNTRAQQLKQLKEARSFLQKHFKRLPKKEITQYKEVNTLYLKVMDMYAYEVLFDFNYM